MPIQTVKVSPSSADTSGTISSKKSNGGAIAGGVIGAFIAIGLIAGAFVYYYRKRNPLPGGRYNRESRLEPGKIVMGGGDTVIEPFPDSDERTTTTSDEPPVRAPVYMSEKSRFRYPGGLPSRPRVAPSEGGTSYTPSYSEQEQERDRYYATSGTSEPRTGTGYDADDGHGTRSPTTTDQDSGYGGSGGGTYVSPYESGARRSARRTTGSASTGREGIEALASLREVAELRREVERIRIAQEQGGASSSSAEWVEGIPPPPSYDEEVLRRQRSLFPIRSRLF